MILKVVFKFFKIFNSNQLFGAKKYSNKNEKKNTTCNNHIEVFIDFIF